MCICFFSFLLKIWSFVVSDQKWLTSSKKSATARASEDFMPREPTFQTLHVASVTFNSLLLGEIMVPDWDMFQVRWLLR